MIGFQFQPGSDEDMRRRLNGQNPQLGPMSNEALKIISMHLPNVLSGRPLSPAELMRPHVGGSPSMPVAGQGAVGPGVPGGRSELSQLMDLINVALHATPAPPHIVAGGGGGLGPANPNAPTPDPGQGYQDPVLGIVRPVQRPALPGPYNPFGGSGEHYGSDRVSRGGASPFA